MTDFQFNARSKLGPIGFALFRHVVCLETHATFSTNQMQDLNQLLIGTHVFPRFSSSCPLAIFPLF